MKLKVKKLNKDEYREFEKWIREHNQENKIAYEVRWTEKDYHVRLCDESIYSMSDIMLDIHNKVGYNTPN